MFVTENISICSVQQTGKTKLTSPMIGKTFSLTNWGDNTISLPQYLSI